MKRFTASSLLTAAVLTSQTGLMATTIIDDFLGGPDVVSLISLAPPQTATGSFLYGGAAGGVRDVFVTSSTVGSFSAGVAFGTGGYASFSGAGQGGVIWDGVSGPVDKNSDGFITVADDFDFGLSLNLLANCADPVLHLQAFADLAGGTAVITLANSATEYALYNISLTTVGAFGDYYAAIGAPSSATGGFDPTNVKAVGLLVNGAAVPDLDVRVSALGVECKTPDAGSSALLLGVGLMALGSIRRVARK